MVSCAHLIESSAVIFWFCLSTINIRIVDAQSTSSTRSSIEDTSRRSLYQNLSSNGTIRYLLLGESAKFTCDISNHPIVWIINSTYYNVNQLPNDYGYYFNKSNLMFFIPVITLWMNNTKYGCYNYLHNKLTLFAHIIVNFDFSGPYDDMKIEERQFFLVPCHTPLMSIYSIYTVWRINGTLYNQRLLPPPFEQKQNGLLVRPLDSIIGKTTLQCLLLSDVLWRDDFYYSDVGSLKVDKYSTGFSGSLLSSNNLHATSVPKIQFHFNNFYFNSSKNSYKISWSAPNAPLCSPPFNYSLVRTSHSQNYTKSIGYNTSYVLTSADISQGPNRPNYEIHVEADKYFMANLRTCSYSDTFLVFSPQVSVIKKFTNIGGRICLVDYPNHGVMWPYLNSNESCLCDSICLLQDCNCVSLTGYTVDVSEESLCWHNLTIEMNNSIVIFYKPIRRSSSLQPHFGTNILKIYQFVLFDPFKAVTVFNASNTSICIQETFRGQATSLAYDISITDNTGFMFYFIYKCQTFDSTCIPIPSVAAAIMNEVCGPQTISVVSKHKFGMSDPVNIILGSNQESNCECLQITTHIHLSSKNVQRTSVSLNISCQSIYTDSSNMELMFILNGNDNFTVTLFSNCSNGIMLYFQPLKPRTTYNLSVKSSGCQLKLSNTTVITIGGNQLVYQLFITIPCLIILFFIIAVAVSIIIIAIHWKRQTLCRDCRSQYTLNRGNMELEGGEDIQANN